MPLLTQPIHEHGDPDRPGPYPHGRGIGQFAQRGWDEDARSYVEGKSAWYSFPAGGGWSAERVKSIPATRLRKMPEPATPGSTFATSRQAAFLGSVIGVPDKPGYLTVYRLGSKAGGLENRNGASLWGIATFLNQEGRSLLKAGMYVTAYYVKGEVEEGLRSYTSYVKREKG